MHPKKTFSVKAGVRCSICLGLLFLFNSQLHALFILTNCPDTAVSVATPKRMAANCPGSSYFISPDDTVLADGGFYLRFMPLGSGQGIARMQANGTTTWGAFVPGGGISPLAPLYENRFLAFQTQGRPPMGEERFTAIGLYNRTGGSLVPIFETELPFGSEFGNDMGVELMTNGTLIFVLDRQPSIAMVAFNQNGSVAWTKEFTSSEFPASRRLFTFPVGVNEFLVFLSTEEQALGLTTLKGVLARFNANGSVLWSRKLQVTIDDGPGTEGAGPFNFHLMPDDEILLSFSNFEIDLNANLRQWMTYLKLNSSGEFQWGRKLEGVSFSSVPISMDDESNILVPLNSPQFGGFSAVLNATGGVASAVQVKPATGYLTPIAISQANEKIYYQGQSNPESSQGKARPLIASSSLTFDDLQCFQYSDTNINAGALRLNKSGRLMFVGYGSGFQDLVVTDSDLAVESDCALFEEVSMTVTQVTVQSTAVEVPVSDIILTNTSFSFEPVAATLYIELTSFSEQPVCEPSTGPAIAASWSTNQVILSWPSSDIAYRLEFKSNLLDSIWVTASPPPILQDGRYIFSESTGTNRSRFFRLVYP